MRIKKGVFILAFFTACQCLWAIERMTPDERQIVRLFHQYLYEAQSPQDVDSVGNALVNAIVAQSNAQIQNGIEQLQVLVFRAYRDGRYQHPQISRVQVLEGKLNQALRGRRSRLILNDIGKGVVAFTFISLVSGTPLSRRFVRTVERWLGQTPPTAESPMAVYSFSTASRTFVRTAPVAAAGYVIGYHRDEFRLEDYFLERMLMYASGFAVSTDFNSPNNIKSEKGWEAP